MTKRFCIRCGHCTTFGDDEFHGLLAGILCPACEQANKEGNSGQASQFCYFCGAELAAGAPHDCPEKKTPALAALSPAPRIRSQLAEIRDLVVGREEESRPCPRCGGRMAFGDPSRDMNPGGQWFDAPHPYWYCGRCIRASQERDRLRRAAEAALEIWRFQLICSGVVALLMGVVVALILALGARFWWAAVPAALAAGALGYAVLRLRRVLQVRRFLRDASA